MAFGVKKAEIAGCIEEARVMRRTETGLTTQLIHALSLKQNFDLVN
jgi:hypothetical protein